MATGFFAVTIISLFPAQTQAANAASWDPGRIIDNSVFTDYNSMSTSQIQSFLEQRVPDCDTNGEEIYSGSQTRADRGRAAGNPPPYTCLKDYSAGGKSAARIIRDASVDYKINPRVMIVLLQKEQGLVTDEWPWPNQYRYATGYCVTDSGLCGDYWTFTKQVRNAAKLFRRILNDPSSSNYPPGRRSVLYNPNRACGSKTVTIQNSATSALYHYTPYVPNSAAMSNLYGTGDGCSAYGNRNFWRFFIDWFGNTRGNYRLFACSGTKYLVEKGIRRKRPISSEGLDAWGLDTAYFKDGDSGCSYPSYSETLDKLIRSRKSGYEYLVDSSRVYKVPNQSVANAWDLGSMSQTLAKFDPSTIKSLDLVGNLPRFAESLNTEKTYLLDAGSIHHAASSPSSNDSARLISGKTTVPDISGGLLSSLKSANGEGTSINYAFKAGGKWYLFDYGKVREIIPEHYTGRWENLDSLSGPTLSTSVLSGFPKAGRMTKGFRRGGYYFRITVSGQVQKTKSASIAKSWGVYRAPLVTSLLANKIVGN